MAERYVLRLYVAGASAGSARAVEALRDLCDEYMAHRYDLDVIDVYQQPQSALDSGVDAVPLLVKLSPAPLRRIFGDLSDREQLLQGLDLKPGPHEAKRGTSKKA